jgi:hypothetical protein
LITDPTGGTADHIALPCGTPLIKNANCFEVFWFRFAEVGVTDAFGGAIGGAVGARETVATPVCAALALLIAVTVTVCAEVIVAGAV